jgi:hypothetical protein
VRQEIWRCLSGCRGPTILVIDKYIERLVRLMTAIPSSGPVAGTGPAELDADRALASVPGRVKAKTIAHRFRSSVSVQAASAGLPGQIVRLIAAAAPGSIPTCSPVLAAKLRELRRPFVVKRPRRRQRGRCRAVALACGRPRADAGRFGRHGVNVALNPRFPIRLDFALITRAACRLCWYRPSPPPRCIVVARENQPRQAELRLGRERLRAPSHGVRFTPDPTCSMFL